MCDEFSPFFNDMILIEFFKFSKDSIFKCNWKEKSNMKKTFNFLYFKLYEKSTQRYVFNIYDNDKKNESIYKTYITY